MPIKKHSRFSIILEFFGSMNLAITILVAIAFALRIVVYSPHQDPLAAVTGQFQVFEVTQFVYPALYAHGLYGAVLEARVPAALLSGPPKGTRRLGSTAPQYTALVYVEKSVASALSRARRSATALDLCRIAVSFYY